jgi:hypothetical protein
MIFRRVSVCSLLPLVLTACSAPDPGAVNPGPPRVRIGTTPPGPGGDDGGGPGPTDGGGGGDSGARDGGDGGGGGGLFALSTNPQQPATPASQRGPHATNNPALTDTSACLDCHRAGGSAAGQQFAFGGRAVRPQGGAPAAGIEICVANPGNQLVGCAKSGTDGFFWAAAGGVALIQGAVTGARLGTGTPMMMGGTLSAGQAGGSCNATNCHGGAQGRVFVP